MKLYLSWYCSCLMVEKEYRIHHHSYKKFCHTPIYLVRFSVSEKKKKKTILHCLMFSNNYYSVSELTQNEIKELKLDTQFMQGDDWKSKLRSLSVPPYWKKWTPMSRLKKSFFAAVAIGIKKKWKGVGKYEDVTLKEVANVFYPGFMDPRQMVGPTP